MLIGRGTNSYHSRVEIQLIITQPLRLFLHRYLLKVYLFHLLGMDI